MKALAAAVFALLGACASTQSARVLAPGKTQVSVGVARNKFGEEPIAAWAGQVEVRHGYTATREVGFQLARTPGPSGTSALGIDPKFQLSTSEDSAVSIALPFLLSWQEDGTEIGGGAALFFPTILAGFDLSPRVELVLSPRIGFSLSPNERQTAYGLGTSIGLHIGDRSKSAFHPELGLMVLDPARGERETLWTIGLGVTAGD